jgi:hypothetical protein
MLGDENDVEIVAAAAAADPEAGNVHDDEQGDAEEEEARQVQPVVEEDQDDDEVADTDADGPPLPERAPGRPRRPPSLYFYTLVVVVLVSAVVALAVAVIVDNGRSDTMVEGDDRSDTMVEGEGLAEVPVALSDFLSDVVALPKGVDGKRRLALPPDMLAKLNGKCATLDEYSPAKTTAEWQCAQSKDNPTFPLEEDADIGTPYQPTDDALELLANATGASLSSLRRMRIESGQPSAPAGSWCGMPSPGSEKLENLSPQDRIAYQYWLQCVKPRAGFFNVLQCEGQCDEGTSNNCSTYAVLGYAALEASVCYPAHVHMAEEAYWQIGGRGWWRTWNNVSDLDDYEWASETNYGGSKYALHPHRSGTPHEFDTTNNLDSDGGAGTSDEPMMMVYWWGLDMSTANNYEWASQVRNDPFQYQESAQTCGDTRRIPLHNNETGPQNIASFNC